MIGPDGTVDRSVGVANTHVIAHAGRIMALVESSFPHVLTPELASVGPCDFDGRLTTAMTAHPKIDPVTGELHFFGYGVMPPYLTYHRLSADGRAGDQRRDRRARADDDARLRDHRAARGVPRPADDLLARPARDGMPFGWDDAYGARLGVMPLDRPGEVRWFDVDPSYVFHVGNAHTDAAGRVVLDAARYGAADAAAMWDGLGGDPAGIAADAAATGAARLHRWVLDPATGAVTETPLHDRGVEFPTMDDARVGRPARYRYAVADSGGRAGVVKFDAEHGTVTEHDLGTDTVAGEAVFVPSQAAGRAEDDGWLLTITTRRDASASKLLVLDATDVAGPPVAAVVLPRGVPAGFHGSWIDDVEIGGRVSATTDSQTSSPFRAAGMLRGLAWDVGLPLVGYYAPPPAGCR